MSKRVIIFMVAVLAIANVSAAGVVDLLEESGVKGGLVVHIGCDDGTETVKLRVSDSYYVHGLAKDQATVDRARANVAATGSYGTSVSIERLPKGNLPYIDNLVNLIICEDAGLATKDEMLRVLAPGGVAYVKQKRKWSRSVKPQAADTDQWTHFLRDASNNAVSTDKRVGPPKHMQWQSGPEWIRSHHILASVSSVVSADGRLFMVADEGPSANPTGVPAKWFVLGQDAYNGILLWKKQIRSWADHVRKFRSGPIQLQRLLVTDGERLYVPLDFSQALSALDCSTGEIVETYAGSEGSEEIILCPDGTLLVVASGDFPEQSLGLFEKKKPGWQVTDKDKIPGAKSLLAFNAENGKLLWSKKGIDARKMIPGTLAADGENVCYQFGADIVCLDLRSGKETWTSEHQTGKKGKSRISGWATSTLVLKDGVVLLASNDKLTAFSGSDGKALWSVGDAAPVFGRVPAIDVFVIDGLVWFGPNFDKGYDLNKGTVEKTLDVIGDVQTAGHHHRCYREKATEDFLILGWRGMEFIDLDGDDHARHNWVRGLCQYGVMPANGMLYAPPHSCSCYMEAKLWGFWALAAEKPAWGLESKKGILEKGAAYGKSIKAPDAKTSEWPTLRGNIKRSGSIDADLPDAISRQWSVKLGTRLTAPVSANGLVFVADRDAHTVYALNASNGRQKWSYVAGGRVDSPPTIYQGLAIFGSRDGWVYCLNASDGELVWRFRGAPADMKTVSLNQLESLWPVSGSVLVQDGVAYFGAGRNTYLDDGIFLYGLEPETGKVVFRNQLEDDAPPILYDESLKAKFPEEKISQNKVDYRTFVSPDKSDGFSMAGATNDVLVGDGENIYLRHLSLNSKLQTIADKPQHLFSTSSLLDDNENIRSHWVIGNGDFSRTSIAYAWLVNRNGSINPAVFGLMLSHDSTKAWGIKRDIREHGFTLFEEPLVSNEAHPPRKSDVEFEKKSKITKDTWSVGTEMHPRAILRAGERIYLGGIAEVAGEGLLKGSDYYAKDRVGLLHVHSTKNGELADEIELASPPVWDGLAASNGSLYLSAIDGTLSRYGAK